MLLLASALTGLTGWYTEHKRVADLEMRIAELQLKEKRSAVIRSVSKQMEEIAYQQKDLSDERYEEALLQKQTAEEMRRRSEVERQNALTAQHQAVASEQKAQQSRELAEREQAIAEHQRIQAEFSKRVADTLSYLALSRSLGSLSLMHSSLGNTQLASLLAYAAYTYIDRYKGDVYHPAIFQSLMTASQSKRTWLMHRGAVTGLSFISGDGDRVITVSNYGEIMSHRKQGDALKSTTLLSDSHYDFRDAYLDNQHTLFAVSRSGHLAIVKGDNVKVIPVPYLENPKYVTEIDDNNILLIGDQGLAVYDKQRGLIVATRELDYRLTAANRYDSLPILFDEEGNYHIVKNINDIETAPIPVSGRVTAFASSKASRQRVYGMSDGSIYLYNETKGSITKLEGHLSRISKLKLNNQRLLSSSYDGTVRLWNTGSTKIESMTMLSDNAWIMNFIFDNSKNYAWIGDQNGNLTEALISVPMMVDMVKKSLKRDFTPDEWDYYIGKNIPYESFVANNGKEVSP